MKIRVTGVRDGLLELGLALLLCVLGVGSFFLADAHQINPIWVFFAWGSFAMVPLFLRVFRGHLKQPLMVLFLTVLAIIHGFIVMGLMRWHIPFVYCFPIFIVELSLGFCAAYRFFGVIPSGDI